MKRAFSKFRSIVRLLNNWPLYVLDYLKLVPRREVTYRLRNGVKFKLHTRTSECVALAEVWVHRQYDPPEGFGDHDVVVDIGANVGLFSVRAATHALRGSVFAFEPAPDNFTRLKENIQLNGLANVIPMQAAIAGKTETRHMYLGTQDTVSHSLWKGWGGSDQQITVQCKTLEDAMREYNITHIDLLKIDCEGAEGEIILGMGDATLRRIRRIGMEVHEWPGSDNTGQLKSFLESKGFLVSTERGFDAVRATWAPQVDEVTPYASAREPATSRSATAAAGSSDAGTVAK